MKIGYFLASEEFTPRDLLAQARAAQEAGFHGLWISDHYHPWNDEQGESSLVWSMIGAVSQIAPGMPVATAVTCPTVRIHPAIIAQAAATSQALCDGHFTLGVGSGEALNEHVIGARWPASDVRLDMLEEAVGIIRELFTGRVVTHRGRHYEVEHARLYTRHETPPPIFVSGFGRSSIRLAARIGDGFLTTRPDPEAIALYRSQGGGDRPVQAGMKVCYGPDRAAARATVHRLWPNEELPGELAQVLPTPEHFEQACELVTEDMVESAVPCGPDLERHAAAIQAYADAGVDELYIQQIGVGHDEFFRVYAAEILPRFTGAGRAP